MQMYATFGKKQLCTFLYFLFCICIRICVTPLYLKRKYDNVYTSKLCEEKSFFLILKIEYLDMFATFVKEKKQWLTVLMHFCLLLVNVHWLYQCIAVFGQIWQIVFWPNLINKFMLIWKLTMQFQGFCGSSEDGVIHICIITKFEGYYWQLCANEKFCGNWQSVTSTR